MASITEVLKLCRLCLMKDEVNTPIFEDVNDISQVFLKISTCLPLKVSRDDNLPKNICDNCSYKLELFYEFLHTCTASEKQLITWLNRLGVENLPVPKVINTLPSSHISNVGSVILKQEVPEFMDSHSVDDITPDDLHISSEAQDYVLQQQQQLPYEAVELEFQQENFMDTQPTTNVRQTATVSSKALKRKRPTAGLKVIPSSLDSEDDEDDIGLTGSKLTKTEEDNSDNDAVDTAFVDLPSTSGENDQPGPSGVGKVAADASFWNPSIKVEQVDHDIHTGFWICNICGQNFANNADVINHVYNAALEMYICCRCGSKFVDEKTFRLHLREHKKQILHQTSYDAPSSSMGKIVDSRVNNMFICKYCDLPFKDRALFYNHSIGHTSAGETKVSKALVKSFTEYKAAEIKTRLNANFKVENLYYGINHRCKKCQLGFFHLDHNHLQADECGGLLRHCDLCSTVFDNNLKLLEHYEKLHRRVKRMCKFCFETFVENKALIHHIIKIHLKFSHYCYDCNEGFVSLQRFNIHLKKHC